MSMNTNASFSSSLPKSFPIPVEDREDFFCVDPRSFSLEQLNEYKQEMVRLIDVEKNNLKRMNTHANARIQAYNQGIALAEEKIKTNSKQTPNLPDFKSMNDGPIGCVNPKNLTITQLQLYIEGITEEITYENKLKNEFQKESTSRIEAYQNGIHNANSELSIRKEK